MYVYVRVCVFLSICCLCVYIYRRIRWVNCSLNYGRIKIILTLSVPSNYMRIS